MERKKTEIISCTANRFDVSPRVYPHHNFRRISLCNSVSIDYQTQNCLVVKIDKSGTNPYIKLLSVLHQMLVVYMKENENSFLF